jgi:hypothetical protein
MSMVYMRRQSSILLLNAIMMVVDMVNMGRDSLTCLVLRLRKGCVNLTNQCVVNRTCMSDLKTLAIWCLIAFFF